MTTIIGTREFIGQFEFSTVIGQSAITHQRTVARYNAMTAVKMAAGKRPNVGGTFTGVADYDDDSMEEELYDLINNPPVGGVPYGVVYGGLEGNVGREIIGEISENSHAAKENDLIMINGAIIGGQIIRTVALNLEETVSATGALVGKEYGAIAAPLNTAAVLRIHSAVALTTVSIKLQQSANSTNGIDGVWSDIAGLNTVMTAPGFKVIDVAVGSAAWLRANVTALTGTSIVLSVTAGELIR